MDKSSNKTRPANGGLVPTLGLFSTVMLVVGGVIGSGIFRKSGVMAEQVGSPELLLLVWVLAGVITLFGALTIAEVAGLIPETGGQYVYFERMYGPFFAFLYGWAAFAIIQSGSISAVAYLFAEYTGRLIPLPDLSPSAATWVVHLPFIGDMTPLAEFGTKGLAAALILVLTVVNYCGVRFGGLVQDVFTIAKLAAMAALVAGALLTTPGGNPAHASAYEVAAALPGQPVAGAIAAALLAAFWAYDGWIKVSYIAGEVKEPQRSVPYALFWGMLIVTAVYLLMNFAYLRVLSIDELARAKKYFVFDVAERIVHGGGRWITAAIMVSTFGTTNAIIMASARVYFAMARAQVFPQFLGRVHPRFQTPAASLVIQGIWAAVLLFSGTFDSITDTLIFVTWIFYAAGAYGVFIMRRRMPAAPRPYKVPGYPVVPWLFILCALAFLGFTVYNDIVAYRAALAEGKPALLNTVFGTALVLLGAPIYFWCRRSR